MQVTKIIQNVVTLLLIPGATSRYLKSFFKHDPLFKFKLGDLKIMKEEAISDTDTTEDQEDELFKRDTELEKETWREGAYVR